MFEVHHPTGIWRHSPPSKGFPGHPMATPKPGRTQNPGLYPINTPWYPLISFARKRRPPKRVLSQFAGYIPSPNTRSFPTAANSSQQRPKARTEPPEMLSRPPHGHRHPDGTPNPELRLLLPLITLPRTPGPSPCIILPPPAGHIPSPDTKSFPTAVYSRQQCPALRTELAHTPNMPPCR